MFSGVETEFTGAEMLAICQRSPPGSWNCRARPRVVFALTLVLAQARLREDPDHAPAWMWAATAHLRLGDYAAAVADAETALRLATPDDPNQGLYSAVLARARYFSGDAQGALDAGEKAMQAPGGNRYAALVVSAAAMELGAVEKGQRVMAEFLACNAGFSLHTLREKTGDAGPNPGEAERRYWGLLLAAGLPGR
jgi:tetratricopeptide (TPR) repeat protein